MKRIRFHLFFVIICLSLIPVLARSFESDKRKRMMESLEAPVATLHKIFLDVAKDVREKRKHDSRPIKKLDMEKFQKIVEQKEAKSREDHSLQSSDENYVLKRDEDKNAGAVGAKIEKAKKDPEQEKYDREKEEYLKQFKK